MWEAGRRVEGRDERVPTSFNIPLSPPLPAVEADPR